MTVQNHRPLTTTHPHCLTVRAWNLWTTAALPYLGSSCTEWPLVTVILMLNLWHYNTGNSALLLCCNANFHTENTTNTELIFFVVLFRTGHAPLRNASLSNHHFIMLTIWMCMREDVCLVTKLKCNVRHRSYRKAHWKCECCELQAFQTVYMTVLHDCRVSKHL